MKPVAIIGFLGLIMLISWPVRAGMPINAAGAEVLNLKKQYSQAVASSINPDELSALALEAVGRTWLVAARYLAIRVDESALHQVELLENRYKDETSRGRTIRNKQLAGLTLAKDAIQQAASLMALLEGNRETWRKITLFSEPASTGAAEAESKMESMVVLSQSVRNLLALTLEAAGEGDKYQAHAHRTMEVTDRELKAIEARPNLHQQGRTFMRVLANLKGCFKITYLCNLAIDEALVAQVEPVRRVWERHTNKGWTSRTELAVTTTALAEITFILVTALVGR